MQRELCGQRCARPYAKRHAKRHAKLQKRYAKHYANHYATLQKHYAKQATWSVLVIPLMFAVYVNARIVES